MRRHDKRDAKPTTATETGDSFLHSLTDGLEHLVSLIEDEALERLDVEALLLIHQRQDAARRPPKNNFTCTPK